MPLVALALLAVSPAQQLTPPDVDAFIFRADAGTAAVVLVGTLVQTFDLVGHEGSFGTTSLVTAALEVLAIGFIQKAAAESTGVPASGPSVFVAMGLTAIGVAVLMAPTIFFARRTTSEGVGVVLALAAVFEALCGLCVALPLAVSADPFEFAEPRPVIRPPVDEAAGAFELTLLAARF